MASLRISVIVAIAIAATRAQTIATNKLAYNVGEGIEISWDYPNNVANNYDWIGVYFDGQLLDQSGSDTLPAGSQMWVYIRTESKTSSEGIAPTGSVTFDANPPDESGSQTWPLAPGTYQAHIVRDVAAPYPTVANSAPFTVSSVPTTAPPPTPTAPTAVISPSVTLPKTSFAEGEDILVSFSFPNNPGTNAWISLWPAGSNPFALPSPSPYWNYICSDSKSSACDNHPTVGQVTLNSDSAGSWSWPLTCGSWQAFLIPDGSGSSFYASVASSVVFSVGSSVCETCAEATSAVSNNDHLAPVDGLDITKVAFSSCYKPSSQINSDLWEHVREFCGSQCVWNWLGDNIYGDTNSQQTQREKYNAARNDQYYSTFGPVANPKIPTTGTWDDHDFGFNNEGENYECRLESQGEFVNHFAVPASDPRHPDQGANQQEGVYSAYMFKKPGTSTDGVHLINLDARFHRSPTFANYGPCAGANSRMISPEQWAWLTLELNRPSEIKIIGSGTQILPPTHRGRSLSSYCSYDGAGNTFDQANAELGEGPSFEGTQYEAWAEIPQERTRLLKLVQESINAGNTKHVIFISGDQHWAEIMHKTIPSRNGQPEVTVFEVTASGIDQNWPFNVPNSNRFRPDTGAAKRNGRCMRSAAYPPGVTAATWTSTNFDTNTCSGDVLHVCNKRANYGGIEVDWASNEVHLSIFTPHETTAESARVTLAL